MKYIGISLGLCLGAALGAAMHNVALGVAIGVALGVAFGLVFSASGVPVGRKKWHLKSRRPSAGFITGLIATHPAGSSYSSGSSFPRSHSQIVASEQPRILPFGFSFRNTAREAGLNAVTVFGGKDTNKYLLETTGSGVAVLDYDGNGWLDIFLVNGSTLEGFADSAAPSAHLYRNKQDGTFEDVTAAAGLTQSGWGQAACAADYDNDGHDDLFVTYWVRIASFTIAAMGRSRT